MGCEEPEKAAAARRTLSDLAGGPWRLAGVSSVEGVLMSSSTAAGDVGESGPWGAGINRGVLSGVGGIEASNFVSLSDCGSSSGFSSLISSERVSTRLGRCRVSEGSRRLWALLSWRPGAEDVLLRLLAFPPWHDELDDL